MKRMHKSTHFKPFWFPFKTTKKQIFEIVSFSWEFKHLADSKACVCVQCTIVGSIMGFYLPIE